VGYNAGSGRGIIQNNMCGRGRVERSEEMSRRPVMSLFKYLHRKTNNLTTVVTILIYNKTHL